MRNLGVLGVVTAFAIALAFMPGHIASAAGKIVDLDWVDLIPKTPDRKKVETPQMSVVQHNRIGAQELDQTAKAVRTDLNGKTVRIPGYIIPLEYDGEGTTEFLLVPYIGACIHVPPPPPNQLVYVKTTKPHENTGLFDPVYVIGKLGTDVTSTDLAEVGYSIAAEKIEPYKYD